MAEGNTGVAGRGRLRILFTSRSGVGHFLPMVPLARALLAAGHEVACCSGPVIKVQAERTGLAFFLAGPDQMTQQQRVSLFPEIDSLAPGEIRAFFFSRVFARREIPLRAPDLARVVESWKPDVLVHEVAELAGPLVASAHGLPYATHSYGPVLGDDGVAAAASGARQFWEEAGLEPHPRAGLWQYLYIDICPPGLQRGAPAGAPAVQQVRPVEREGRRSLTGRPLVYVTLGTIYNADVGVFRTILDGLAGEPVDVVVTIGSKGEPDALGPQPLNVRVERFIPQAEVLRDCSAVITHGGAGTTFGALAFGCPILFVPQGADQFVNAQRVLAVGAGLQLLPGQVSAATVRAAVRRLLSEPLFASAARRIGDEIAAMPGPDEAINAIERLVASNR